MNLKGKGLYVLASIIIAGAFGFLAALFFCEIPAANKDTLTMASGALLAAFGSVVGYFFGSSKGSADKTDLLKGSPAVDDPRQGKLPLAALVSFAAAVSILFTGCTSPEQAAYRSVGTIATAVDASMKGWGDYVRAGHATADEEKMVREIYGEYQRSMAVVERLALSAKTAPDGQASYQTAVNALAASADQIVDLVKSIIEPKGKTP